MRITWVTRSFLDYRIPVFKEIDRLCGNQLTVIYFKDVVPVRCQEKLQKIIGERAIGLSGEVRIGGKKIENQAFANAGGFRIPVRPGLVLKVKSTEPDLILSDGFFQWTYAALLNNALWGTPHIMCYERTLHTERNVSKSRVLLRKIAAKYIDAICCNGIQTKEYLARFGYPENRLFLGNMAADSKGLQESVKKVTTHQIAKLRKDYKIKGLVFLVVGQLIPRKGIMQLLAAWKHFSKNRSAMTLMLVGGGELKKQADDYIIENQLSNIRLIGSVDYSETVSFYAMADIFLIATLEDNWSLVVPEAMACGLPIICSKYNGCWPELVKSENGWVFDPLNAENFVQTLQTAWNHKEQWKLMGQESVRIVADYSPEKVAGSIYQACQSVLKEG
jgi:glycosyltransferase involved in cell wall biosynthesis